MSDTNTNPVRRAVVRSKDSTLATIQRYLPANYEAHVNSDGFIVIEGQDSHGWTLDDYVLPRLASGLHFAEEVPVTSTVVAHFPTGQQPEVW
jgi:hypothetical protein